jgi:hypothetical protein
LSVAADGGGAESTLVANHHDHRHKGFSVFPLIAIGYAVKRPDIKRPLPRNADVDLRSIDELMGHLYQLISLLAKLDAFVVTLFKSPDLMWEERYQGVIKDGDDEEEVCSERDCRTFRRSGVRGRSPWL